MDLETPEARIAKWGYDPEGKINSCSAITWISAPTFGIPAAYFLVAHPNPAVRVQSLISMLNTLAMMVCITTLVTFYPLKMQTILWYFLIGYTIVGVIMSVMDGQEPRCPEHEWADMKARYQRGL